MIATDFFSTVFLVWFLGCYVFFVQGIPKRVIAEDRIRTPKDTESSQSATFDENVKSAGGRPKYEVISQSIVDKENVMVSKECDDEEECEPGSGDDNDRIPIIKLLPALKKDSIPVDAFAGDVSNNKEDDVTYEIISKSTTAKEKDVSSKACDDEDECGSADDTFDNKGGGDEIKGGLSPQKSKDVVPEETTYKIISKSMVEKDESKPPDVFTAEKAPNNENAEVKYEIISKSMTNGDNDPAKKDCDDEDECGSAGDVFSNDDSSDRIIKGLSFREDKEPTPTEVSGGEKPSKNEDDAAKYQIISRSMTNVNKDPPKKDCDDEDECGSAVEDVFRNNDDDDGTIKSVSLSKDKEPTPPDISATEKAPNNEDEVKYEIISQSMANRNQITSKKDCDDEDECGSADDVFSNDDSSDGIMKGLSPSKDKDSLAGKTAHYEVLSMSMIENDDSTTTDAFSAGESSSSSPNKENTKVTYEIISKSMINGDKKLSGKACDDEDKCGNADNDFTSDDNGDKDIRAPSPPKEQDPTLTDASGTEKTPKNDDGEVKYEIISKSLTNGNKPSSQKNCDDEDECDDAFSHDGDGSGDGIIDGRPSSKNKEPAPTEVSAKEKTPKNEDTEVKYEIISKSLTNGNKPSSEKNCDDEDECDDAFSRDGDGSGDEVIDDRFSSNDKEIPFEETAHYEVISKIMGEKDDSKLTDAFTSEKSSGTTSKKENSEHTYEIISQSVTNVGEVLPSKKNCDDEDECGSADVFINDGDGEEDGHSKTKDTDKSEKTPHYEVISKSMVEKEDPTPTGTFIAGGSSSSLSKESEADVSYEIISKSMTNGDKSESNKNCDDEDECGSTDDVFSDNDDGSEYKIIKELSPPKDKDGLSQKKTHYEIISQRIMDKENPTLKECDDDDDEDCQLLNGGSGDDKFDAGREFSPPKFQTGPQVSVESTLQPLFRGTSFLELQPLGKDAQDSIEAELEIFPLEKTGVLLYNGWQPNKIGDFISLSIQDGLVELSFDCRSGPIKIRTMASIEMNKWNKIEFSRSGRLGSLTLNDEYSAMGFSPEPRSSLILYNKLLVGGVPEKMRSEVNINIGIDKGFTGYIRNLKVQGRSINLQMDSIKESMMKKYCFPSLCENSGQCVENGNGYSCLCKAPYRGRHCNEEINLQPISFHRESYVRFNKAALLQILQGQDGHVTFSILTTQSRGLLLWESQKLTKQFQRYATVGLTVGFVSLRFNLGTGRRKVDSSLPVNDGEWHEITIARRKGSCVLIIDNQHKTKFNSFNNKMPVKTNVQLYIGGVPNIKSETKGLYKTGFKGCLKKFKINNDYIDFVRDYIASQGTSYCGDI